MALVGSNGPFIKSHTSVHRRSHSFTASGLPIGPVAGSNANAFAQANALHDAHALPVHQPVGHIPHVPLPAPVVPVVDSHANANAFANAGSAAAPVVPLLPFAPAHSGASANADAHSHAGLGHSSSSANADAHSHAGGLGHSSALANAHTHGLGLGHSSATANADAHSHGLGHSSALANANAHTHGLGLGHSSATANADAHSHGLGHSSASANAGGALSHPPLLGSAIYEHAHASAQSAANGGPFLSDPLAVPIVPTGGAQATAVAHAHAHALGHGHGKLGHAGHVRGIRSACDTPDAYAYNRSYPLTPAARKEDEIKFSIGMISDLDEDSRQKSKKDLWRSHLKRGQLTWHPLKNEVSVKWDKGVTTFSTTLNMKGRGMEFSELVVFDGRLLTFDDRTGVIYYFEGDNAYPWVILMDGNGKSSKGFKAEWATVKDNQLYVGSTGKEKTTSKGEFVSNDPYWIKVVSPRGEVQAYNWTSNYKRLAKAIDIEPPGYVIHESGVWSDTRKKWFFLPRRCSKEKYNKDKNESRSCNVLLIADETFENVQVLCSFESRLSQDFINFYYIYVYDFQAILIGGHVNVRGFSSFKFLPGTNDTVIVALKTKELENDTATYITVFSTEGKILMPDLKVDNDKYEGLEFL
ncbi:unnamed protein product [Trichogramma brassicae]|uniref:Apyrase n=1 Tax=Trichogramma brassicae TaxID=86971 RepID=A0A6H5IZ03_9HYME|nr:unnamed protein product [Trichogramma brassicae]